MKILIINPTENRGKDTRLSLYSPNNRKKV